MPLGDFNQGSWNEYQKLVLSLLEKHEEKNQELEEELQRTKLEISRLRDQLDNQSKELITLLRVVRDGNGQPPILKRIDSMESTIGDLKLYKQNTEEESKKAAHYRRGLFLSIGTTIVTIIIEVVMFLLKKG